MMPPADHSIHLLIPDHPVWIIPGLAAGPGVLLDCPGLRCYFFPAAPAGDSTRAFPLVAQAPRVGLLVLLQVVLAFHILPTDGARDSLVIVAAITPASVTACAAAVTIAFTALIAAPIIRMTAPLTAWQNHQQDILTG